MTVFRAGLRVVAALVVTALAVASGAARAQAPALDLPQARLVAARMQADPAWARAHATCPVDLPRRRAPVLPTGEHPSQPSCAGAPLGCFEACKAGSGAHCFSLARAFQDDGSLPSRHWEQLFAAACAGGAAAGCTNRAAGIRNGAYADDPFRKRTARDSERCQRRSFTRACAGADAWGCAMLGQSWRHGEGGPINRTRARRAYERACKLAPGSSPCEFAGSGLTSLDR